MRAMVRFATGERSLRAITNVENIGSSKYGWVRYQGKQIPVSQSTTIRYADGRVEKEWDEVVQVSRPAPHEEEDW